MPWKKISITLLTGLVIGFLLSDGLALADERFVIKPPLQRQLESLILPEVRLADTDLMDALLYLQMKARTSPQNAMRISFVVNLPADFKPRYELSLDLKTVPFWEALRHLCGQAGVDFSIERGAITIRPMGSASAPKATVRTEMPAPAEPSPVRGLAGRLGKPSQPLVSGSSVHRSMGGEVQPERSGSVGQRNLGGWSVVTDPHNQISMNCVHLEKCMPKCPHDGSCGCYACTCHNMDPETKAGPKP